MAAIKKILIVGGGTSGWMTAAYLNRALNSEEKRVEITLIEASDISTIGVGEATIPMLGGFFSFLGMTEQYWMEACKATYKMAIKFKGWVDGRDDDYYWHTFGQISRNHGPNISVMQHWLHRHRQGDKTPFAQAVHDAVYVCEAKKAPKAALQEAQRGKPTIPYAFHLDAGLVVDLLRDYAKKSGVQHLLGKVNHTHLDEKGFIQYLTTKEQGMLEADLYIDCSGFSSILIEKALKTPYISYSDSLFCDRAIAIGTDYEEGDIYNEKNGGLNPYTTATALNSGWTWHTPLQGRDGNGYVYSSRFASEGEAEKEFRQHLGTKAAQAEARFLKMRVGRMKNFWVNNCVAIGLAGGFIEPLESTGLALIQTGIRDLIQHFPDTNFSPWLIADYNQKMREQYDHIRDFIILHYILTQREDTPFWKAVKYDTHIPDSLQSRLEEWKTRWMTERDYATMFGPFNHISILAGMNYLPEKSLPITAFYREKYTNKYFEQVKKRGEQLAKSFPTQAQYFRQLQRIQDFKANQAW